MFLLSSLDHDSGTPARRASEGMLQVDTPSSLALRASMLSLLATAGAMIKALLSSTCQRSQTTLPATSDSGAILMALRAVDLVTRGVSADGKEDLAHASGCDSRHYLTSGH